MMSYLYDYRYLFSGLLEGCKAQDRGLLCCLYPEFRGNGSIRKLMTDILEDNYEA